MKLHQSRTAARIDIFSPRKCQFSEVHISALAHHTMLHLQSFSWLLRHSYEEKNLPKAQRTQGIEYFDSLNTANLKQKLQQALKSWSNFSLVLFGKEREKHRTTLTNPCNTLTNPSTNFDKSMYQLREIQASILTNPCNN